MLVCSIVGGFAQTQAKSQPRTLSLQDAIKLAVEHNLDVQVASYVPRLSLYSLNAYNAAYDPTFSFTGDHQHDEAGSRLLGGGFSIPGSRSDADELITSLRGVTPWGLSYGLEGSARDNRGDSFGINKTNGLVERLPFESTIASASVVLTQPLLKNFFIDENRLNIRVGKNRVKYSEEGFKLQLMTIIAATEETYYSLIGSREYVKVQEKAVELANQLLAENRKRVEVGAMAPLDEKQAASQAASSRADLISAQNAVAILENLLKSLITDEYSNWAPLEVVPTDPLKAERQFFDRQDSWSKGLTQRPDFKQAKLDVEEAGIQVKYARNQLLPQVDLFGSYGYNGSGNEFSDAFGDVSSRDRPFYTFGGRIIVPLGNRVARNQYQSRKALQEQAVLSLKRMEQQVMKEIDDAIKQAQSSFQRVGATRAAREFAEAALEAEQKKLESGKSTSFEVLRLQRDLTTAGGEEIRALADYNNALARLRKSEGTTLQYRGVDVETEK